MQGELNTLGKRLRWAIERRPADGREKGVRKFQRDLHDRADELREQGEKLMGTSLPSIMSYLNDDGTPSLPFLQEAADLCGVRAAWLAFDDGEPIDTWEATRVAAAQVAVGGPGAPRFAMLASLTLNRFPHLPMSVRWILLNFLLDHFENDDEAWSQPDHLDRRRNDVDRVLTKHFGPLFPAPTMQDFQVTAMAASLASAAYLHLASDQQTQEEDHGA